MKNDAIIFDIDGTLWNACPACAKGWNDGLKKLGINKTITSKQIENVAGKPYEECIEILLPKLQQKHPELLKVLNEYEMKAVKSNGGKFYENAIEGIKTLSKSHKIFLVSNCQEWYLKIFLKFSNLEPFLTNFDCHGMSNLPKNKMLKRIKEKHSLKNPVYIGDTEGDESATNQAKMEFIHMSYGFGKPKNNPKRFNSFNALLKHFQNQT